MPDVLREKEEISLIITTKENTEVWKKMKHKTTSAFGTPGFSHYKIASKFEDMGQARKGAHRSWRPSFELR